LEIFKTHPYCNRRLGAVPRGWIVPTQANIGAPAQELRGFCVRYANSVDGFDPDQHRISAVKAESAAVDSRLWRGQFAQDA
jgi:hypothetical protein